MNGGKKVKIRHQIQKFQRHGIHINSKELASCFGKVRYFCYKDAKIKVLTLVGIKPYKCKYCKFYHFGHNK